MLIFVNLLEKKMNKGLKVTVIDTEILRSLLLHMQGCPEC